MLMYDKSFCVNGFKINIVKKLAFTATGFTRLVKLEGGSINAFLKELETTGRMKQLSKTLNSPQQIWVCLSDNEKLPAEHVRCTVCVFQTEKHDFSTIPENELFSLYVPETDWADFEVGSEQDPTEMHSHDVYKMVGEIGCQWNKKVRLHFDNEYEWETERNMHFLLPVVVS